MKPKASCEDAFKLQVTSAFLWRGATQLSVAMGVPLVSRQDVYREMGGLLPVNHTFYLADQVLPSYRHKGLGAHLIQQRLEAIDREIYSHVVLRISTSLDVTTNLM